METQTRFKCLYSLNSMSPEISETEYKDFRDLVKSEMRVLVSTQKKLKKKQGPFSSLEQSIKSLNRNMISNLHNILDFLHGRENNRTVNSHSLPSNLSLNSSNIVMRIIVLKSKSSS